MANASKHHIGAASHGKGSGLGGMTDPQDDLIEPNMILSNRDKSRHSDQRGLDSKAVQTDQLQDNPANHELGIPDDADGNVTGSPAPCPTPLARKAASRAEGGAAAAKLFVL